MKFIQGHQPEDVDVDLGLSQNFISSDFCFLLLDLNMWTVKPLRAASELYKRS